MLSANEFLSAVLPPSGRYCLFLLPSKKHLFFSTIPELGEAALRHSAAGETVYHACATFLSDIRKAANADLLGSFYLDLDCGEGKGYATQMEAAQALLKFTTATNLPFPTLVSSGYGVHAYWPLAEALPAARWLPLAQGLKRLCAAHGLRIDPTVPADAARILRPVGTFNYKDPTNPKPVTCGALMGPFPLAALEPIFLPGRVPQAGLLQIADALTSTDSRPAYAQNIALQCAQIEAMAHTKGQMSEPEWHACMGILAFCADGQTFAHEWSKGDPRYSQAETQGKFDRAKALTGPTTCAHFQSINALCLGCPQAGNLASPVQLGRQTPPPTPTVKAEAPETLPLLWYPFLWGREGQLMWQQEGNSGELINHIITEFPLLVQRVAKGEVHFDRFTIGIKSYSPHDGWEEFEIAGDKLMANAVASTMASYGIVVCDVNMFRKYIGEAINNKRKQEKAAVQYEQFGWKPDRKAFLLGTRLYHENGSVVEVQGSSEVRKRGIFLRPGGVKKRGSLEEWQRFATKMCAPGLEAHTFAMLCGFAAPLISFLTDDEGGGIVSLVSHETGRGKTTSIDAAASIWGDIAGCDVAHIDTKVSRGLVMGVLGNLPVRADELVQRDPEALKEIVQIFTGGRDKQRATQNGELQHNLATWRTIMLTTSNKSLIDTILTAKGSPAMGARILEFDVSHIDKTRLDVSETKRGLHNNTGFAGDIYLRALVRSDNRRFLEDALFKQEEALIGRYGFGVDDRYRVRVLSAVYVGGTLARVLGLLDISVDRIVAFACDEILNQRNSGRFSNKSALEILSEWLRRNQRNVLVVPHRFTQANRHMRPLRPFNGELYARHEVDTNRILIAERAVREFLSEEDFSAKQFAEDLHRRNILIGRLPQVSLGAGVDELRTGPTRCFEIDGDHPDLRPLVEEAPSNVIPLRKTQ